MTKNAQSYANLVARHLSTSTIPRNNLMQHHLAEARLAEDARLVAAVARLAGTTPEALANRLACEQARSDMARDELLEATAKATAGQ